ncbi:hypothetical protein SKAU_G00260250 [Synaphobranchus kaupii]|uniref:Uncharacterized protein n=1 Tax=Synaphobranchus kaupii TaxID=118154 RepID=A0A9Q1F4J8_SYNKA|nr:hypothetical protein SKAU_G00260250 [Synaphobranchus kaupii]
MSISDKIQTFSKKMIGHSFLVSVEALLFAILSVAAVEGRTTSRPSVTPPGSVEGGEGGLQSILRNTMSPAFGATVIIIVTVVVSGSAYLCFIKYICIGCCKPAQVIPASHLDPNKSEEQV